MTAATAAYAFGNCTYYVATRFPSMYAYLGNAKDWITNAKKQGYAILNKPTVDTAVVYGPGNGYSDLGHVAVVDAVNADGTFQVSEMNYNGYDVIDQRRSTMQGVLGFIVLPGSTYVAPAASAAASASTTSCVLGGPSLFGTTICMDGVVGVLAMAGGGLLMVAGIAVFAAFALKQTGFGDKIANMPLAGGPMGIALKVAESQSTPKAKPTLLTPAEGKAASDARVAVAKARLSPGTQREVDAAKYGKGSRLSSEAHTELSRTREEKVA